MTTLTRLAVVGYMVIITAGLLAGSWPLQGPVILRVSAGHGLHAGDLLVLLATASACIAVLKPRPFRQPR